VLPIVAKYFLLLSFLYCRIYNSALGFLETKNERGDFTYEELRRKACDFLGI
jgi:hypothetical protein